MLKILVVDDDAQVRNALNEICSYLGSPVVQAANGQEGLERTKTQQFDLIFVDWNMPVMDGIEFINQLLKDRSYPKIVLMSGSQKISDVDPAILQKIQFLPKPFPVATIKKILKSV